MAGQLVHYGFLREDHDSVEAIVSRAENLIKTYPDNELKEFLDELKQMKGRVEQQELWFYHAFGANNFQQFNDKLQQIQNSYDPLLSGGASIWNIRKHIDFDELTTTYSQEDVQKALSSAIEEFLHEDGREAILEEALSKLGEGETSGEIVRDFIQKNLRVEDKKGKSNIRFITQRGKNQVGLGKFIIGYDFKKHEVIINTEGIEVSPAFKKKLNEALNILVPNKIRKRGAQTYTDSGFRKRINELALEKIVDGKAKDYIKEAMEQKEQFDLKPNLSSVIGYLGEVRAVAILNHLTPSEKAKGVGNLYGKMAISGNTEEIPIDVICMSWGFQVKNYNINKNGQVTFSNEAGAPYILESRMHFTGPLYETLIDLFGVYQYNQPFTFSSKDNLQRLDEYEKLYASIYSDNDSVFRRLTPMFNSRIPHMLRMSERFKTKEGDFTKEDVYFNTFYWINKKLVPSSYILTQIIEQLEGLTENKNVTAEYYLKSRTPGVNLQNIPLMSYRNKSTLEAAKYLNMKYEITIDLSNFG